MKMNAGEIIQLYQRSKIMTKVFECEECDKSEPCILFDKGGNDFIHLRHCPYKKELIPEWHETNKYKLKEIGPDYEKMAENKQFGKFWDTKAGCIYGYLTEYIGSRFRATSEYWDNFTPCTIPTELDPMEV